jgi:hypothetical protein
LESEAPAMLRKVGADREHSRTEDAGTASGNA